MSCRWSTWPGISIALMRRPRGLVQASSNLICMAGSVRSLLQRPLDRQPHQVLSVNGGMNGRMGGWMDGWMGWMDVWMDGWMGG